MQAMASLFSSSNPSKQYNIIEIFIQYYYLTAVLYLTHLLLSIIESLDEWDEEELDAELNSFIVNVAIAATATEEAP